MFLINKYTGPVLFLSVIAINSQAVELASLTTEEDMFSDFSVSSATRLAQSPRDLPVSTTIITREMIDAAGVTEIPELFRMVPGFRVVQYDGTNYGVFGHGASNTFARKIEVLLDGLPVKSPALNQVFWSRIPVEISDIDYIEVMRGTGTAVYGSNAFDGVINIVTRKPFEDEGHRYEVTYGDHNRKNYNYKYGFLSESGSHSISLTSKSSTGFETRNDNSKYTKIRYNANFTPTVNDEIDVLVNFSAGYKGGQDTSARHREADIDANTQYIKWKYQAEDNNIFTLKAYHIFLDTDDSYSLGLISDLYNINPALVPTFFNGRSDQEILYSYNEAKYHRYGLDVQQSIENNLYRIVVGGAFTYDDITSKNLFGSRGRASGMSRQLFSNLEWHLRDDFILNAGILVEKIESRKEEYSKRLSFNYHLNESNTVRLGIAESYRGRSVFSAAHRLVARYESDNAIFGTVLDNQGYDDPEKVVTVDMAQLINLPKLNLSFDWRLFHDQYSDFRNVVNDSNYSEDAGNGAFVNINAGSYSVKGLELQLKYTVPQDWFIAAHYTKVKTEGLIANNIEKTEFLDFHDAMPEKIYGFTISKTLDKHIDIGAIYTRVDSTKWLFAGKTPGYKRLDVNIASRFKVNGTDAKLVIAAQNILNEYSEYRVEQRLGKRMMIRFTLDY